ncbi:MAG: trypsin-like peptidase domain-containing protein [Bdellovibrionaceae bacterium]|nr:trypsin-like peptidase domain-containing protein [Pseudobdellovibrionaceae bacterium]
MKTWGFTRSICIISFALITNIACQKSDDTKYPFPTYDSSLLLNKELEQTTLNCENTECESNKKDFESIGLVGMVVEGEPEDYNHRAGQCTGFLFGSQSIVALNSHCVTDSIWSKRRSCGKYLAIKFPETPGHPSEIRECQEIIYRSDLEGESGLNIKSDYAFFRIKPVSRAYLPITTTPTGNQQTISVRKVNPLKNVARIGGTLDYANCTTQTNSLLNINYTDEWAKTGLGVKSKNSYKPCKIIQGNSGSPVLNSRNEIIGFAQSYVTSAFIDIIQSSHFKKLLSAEAKINIDLQVPSTLPEHFHYTQAICAFSPGNLTTINSACKSGEDSSSVLSAQMSRNGFENATSIDEYVNKLKNDANARPTMFQYEVKKDAPDRYVYSLNPKCVLSENKWDTTALDKSSLGMITGGGARNIRVSEKPLIYELGVYASYDENFTIRTRRLSHTTQNVRFTTSIQNNSISVSKGVMHRLYSFEESSTRLENIGWCRN